MSDVTSADGTRIGHESLGTGPAIVVVDGAMCFRDSGPARGIAAALATHLTVHVYDRRGRGASGDTAPFAVEREIEDIAAVIDAAGGTAALLGMSSGGALAARAAAALGDAVTHLIAYEPPFMPPPARDGAAAYTAALTAALERGDRDGALAAFFARVGVPDAAVETMRRSPGWEGNLAIAPTLAYDDAAMGDSSVPDDLAAIGAPTLALAGSATPDFLQWGARELAATVPGATFALVEGQGHAVDPDALAPHVVGLVG
ncbi:alpha/beta fold hydrolase [Demequina phytophila]|uniref:alpha/beta fold hydrolase n=1 Tax=Demequina phytophila TaxID=1638981 RepID=UPI000784C5A1|nr:alpha/beta hydrolase [Demequina phytophila]